MRSLRGGRWPAPALVAAALGLGGCSNEVKLADVPPVNIPESKPPEAQPKHLRPDTGSSAGMNYNPGGYGAQGRPSGGGRPQ